MDFTPELSALQGVISSANQVYPISRLTCKGGNEESIKYLVDSLTKFLKDGQYINDNGIINAMVSKIRKFALYLVLNADFKILESMVEIEGIFVIIWSSPTIPKHLMCELLWGLHMEEYISEIITYCYPPLAIAVASAFADHFKYFDPFTSLAKLHKLCTACYALICRLHCFELDKEDFDNILVACYDTLKKLLKYFTDPPNSYKLMQVKKDDLYKFKGDSLKTMLLLICDCFNLYTHEVNSSFFNDVYKSTYTEDCFKINPPTSKVCECPDVSVQECVNNCNMLLLDVFKEIVMEVSVDIFCAWSEFETNGKSMQQTIGELCHKVRTILLNVSSVLEHPVIDMIQQMARKPVVIEDIINITDTDVIVQNISSNNQDRALWLHALVHKEELCQHIELIEVINSNLDIFDESECCKLYKKISTYGKSNTNNRELVTSLAVKIFQYCNVTNKQQFLREEFKENQFHDLNDGDEFQNMVTEMFNKFVAASDADLTKVLDLFLQNPRQVYNKIFVLAKENGQLTNTMIKIMELLKEFSNHYYVTETEPCLISTIKNIFDDNLDSDIKQENVIRFLSELKNVEIIPSTKLLLLIIMPSIHKALINKDITRIHVQIQLLNKAYIINELLQYRAPILAMLLQILEVVRLKNIRMFEPNATAALQLTLDFQKSLMDTYDNTIPDDEGNWLRARLNQMDTSRLNKYYYRRLWDNYSGTNFFEGVSGLQLSSNINKLSICASVTQVLCSCTLKEWYTIWDDIIQHCDDIETLRIFYESFRAINTTVESIRTPATKGCLFYCFQNMVFVLRYKFIKEPVTEQKFKTLVGILVKFLKLFNKEDVDEISARLMPLIAYLVAKKSQYTIDIPDCFKNTLYYNLINNACNGTQDQNDIKT